jgi:hypothetical protein
MHSRRPSFSSSKLGRPFAILKSNFDVTSILGGHGAGGFRGCLELVQVRWMLHVCQFLMGDGSFYVKLMCACLGQEGRPTKPGAVYRHRVQMPPLGSTNFKQKQIMAADDPTLSCSTYH